MRFTAVFLSLAFCWAQAADTSGPVTRYCVSNHQQGSENFATPGQLLWRLDSGPSAPGLLEQQVSQLKADPNNPKRHLTVGLAFLKQADTARWDYLTSAKDHFLTAKTAFPKDPFVLMYLGRATGALALNLKPSLFTRLKLAREGFRLMDQSVKIKPDCIWLRLLRAEAQLMAHPILRRGERLKMDAQAVSRFMKSSAFELMTTYQQAKIHLFLGCYLQKIKSNQRQIQNQWQLALAKASNTDIGAEARARLNGYWQEIGYSDE